MGMRTVKEDGQEAKEETRKPQTEGRVVASKESRLPSKANAEYPRRPGGLVKESLRSKEEWG